MKPNLPARSTHRLLCLAVLGLLLTPSMVASQDLAAGVIGPDVTVSTLTGTWKSSIVTPLMGDSYIGYHVGTESCNIGDTPLKWCTSNQSWCDSNDHPVIGQNVYRLKDDRFEQIGMSWLKHGFLSLNSETFNCGPGTCTDPPHGGAELGVGCTDIYSSGLNAGRPLGMSSEVQSTNGEQLVDYTTVPSPTFIHQRAQVKVAELTPAENVGALYWVEGQYIASDDATSGNGLNNASYRPVAVSASLSLSFTGGTVRERSAIEAWPAIDPEVSLVNVDIRDGGINTRFHAARKIVVGGAGGWHYEYAIHNMNSDRGARSLTVDFSGPATISNVGFRDVDHHSGEPYKTTDWAVTVDGAAGTVTWTTDDFATDEDANALRWGTTFSFWFDSNLGPDEIDNHVLGLFKPGLDNSLNFSMSHPFLFVDGFESGDTTAW